MLPSFLYAKKRRIQRILLFLSELYSIGYMIDFM